MKKSIVFSALLPSAVDQDDIFETGIQKTSLKGFDVVEFFCPFPKAAQRGRLIKEHGMQSIFLAAGYQKTNKLSLCSTDEAFRRHSMSLTKRCLDAAVEAGAAQVLLTSGAYPADAAQEAAAFAALARSFSELNEYANGNVGLLLEPGDRNVDSRQLIGPTQTAVDFIAALRSQGIHACLTMDTSHIAQLGENVLSAVDLALPYCNHVHLANCILNPASPLYGDKHPLFDVEHGVFSTEDILGYLPAIRQRYAGKDLTLAFEIISREEDFWSFFDLALERTEVFFKSS